MVESEQRGLLTFTFCIMLAWFLREIRIMHGDILRGSETRQKTRLIFTKERDTLHLVVGCLKLVF